MNDVKIVSDLCAKFLQSTVLTQHISNFLMVAAKEVNHIINSKPIKSKLIYSHNLKLLAKIAKLPKRKFLSALSSSVIYDLPSLIKILFAEKVHSNLIKHFRKNQPYLIISNKKFHNCFFKINVSTGKVSIELLFF